MVKHLDQAMGYVGYIQLASSSTELKNLLYELVMLTVMNITRRIKDFGKIDLRCSILWN